MANKKVKKTRSVKKDKKKKTVKAVKKMIKKKVAKKKIGVKGKKLQVKKKAIKKAVKAKKGAAKKRPIKKVKAKVKGTKKAQEKKDPDTGLFFITEMQKKILEEQDKALPSLDDDTSMEEDFDYEESDGSVDDVYASESGHTRSEKASVAHLSDESEDVEEDEYGYGWDYTNAFDDPDEADEDDDEEEGDEDAQYAMGEDDDEY